MISKYNLKLFLIYKTDMTNKYNKLFDNLANSQRSMTSKQQVIR